MKMEAIGYCRVSTATQVEEGVSLQAQREKIKAWCAAHDYELVAIHTDEGLSGSRCGNRRGLEAALTEVCRRKAALVVYSLSRLSRSIKDTIAISERLNKSGADLVSLSERIDTTSASGRMVFRMLAVLNEFERAQISERTKLAMAHKRQSNELVGEIPFGFDLGRDGKTLTPNAKEQRTLGTIHRLRRDGLSYRAIAARLTQRHIRTKTGNKQWAFSTIRRILQRPGSATPSRHAPSSRPPVKNSSLT